MDDELVLGITSRGEWRTFENKVLPKLKPRILLFNRNKILNWFESAYAEVKSGVLANDIVKAQIMTLLSYVLYSEMEFEDEVSIDDLMGPHRRLNVIEESISLSEILKDKMQKQIIGPGGEPING